MWCPVGEPDYPTGGVVGLKGNLAPEGAIVKVAGMSKDLQVLRARPLLRQRGGDLRGRF
jgi:dihydroxyacid dehydratase/phosphogluconate dehydratase